MKQPIAVTMRKISRWSLKKQRDHLLTLIAQEKPRSVRRAELVAAVSDLVQRDLKAGDKGLKRSVAA